MTPNDMQTAVTRRRFRFGSFDLDLDTRELRRDRHPVRIQPQPLRVLEILVQHAGHVVTREDLRQQIWGEATFVEFDQGLNYCIRQIRLALGDDATKPVFVETLKKRGYRFAAAVEVVEDTTKSTGPAAEESRASEPSVAMDPLAPRQPSTSHRWRRVSLYTALAVALLTAAAGFALRVNTGTGSVAYSQLTSFTDAAFEPAISPDGRMLAFLVGSDTSFPYAGEVSTMMLPDGEPIQRTHDGFPKYGVAFSPDGTQITYTVGDAQGWTTASVSVLGGEPRVLLRNAAGLSWLDSHHALFSEIKTGLHMGLVAATDRRDGLRRVYTPEHERGMTHYAHASPDRKSVLVVEMGPTGAWGRCRLVPFDGGSAGSSVGPDGPCTAGAWSADGRWMYFTAVMAGASHVWREPFPSGTLEQITTGPAQERGVAMSPDSRSLVTSVGMLESGVWIHSRDGDRLLSADGYASLLSFSHDGRSLLYLLRRASTGGSRELWQTDVESSRAEPVVQGYAISGYDVTPAGDRIVFASVPGAGGSSEIWIAARDHETPPHRLVSSGADSPAFGPAGEVLFRKSENQNNYLLMVDADGSRPRRVMANPIVEFKGMSPDRRFAIVMVPVNEVPSTAIVAVPIDGGPVRRICPAQCMVAWSPDATRMYIEPLLQHTPGGTLVIPVPKGQQIPELPPEGVRSAADAASLPGSAVIDLARFDPTHDGTNVAPGATIDTFAYARTVSHRNLFRVALP